MSTLRMCTHLDCRRGMPAMLACLAALGVVVATAHAAWPLTLAEAIDAATAASPELAALEQEKRALAAAVDQARVLRNPELQTEVENVGGTGGREGDEAAESTLRLSQTVELGGKRSARTQVAASAADAAAADLELERRDLVARVKAAFAATLAAQQRVALARDLEQLAGDALRSVGSAVGAGAMSSAERDRARLTVANANRELARSERQAAAARAALAATWGDVTARFEDASGRLDASIVLPARENIAAVDLDDHPSILRARATVAEQAAAVSLARANRIPDVTVAAGARHFNDDNDVAAVFSLSAPLPLFDRNRGAVVEAEARLGQAREKLRAAEIALRTSLSAAYEHCVAADEQSRLLDRDVIPAATRAVETTTAAHRAGVVAYQEIVHDRRSLYELRSERIDRLEERYLAAVELERISGLTLIDASEGGAR